MFLSDDLPRLRLALEQHHGNISRAAKALGVSKSYIMELVRKCALNEWARELRRAAGLPSTGRPPRDQATRLESAAR